MKWNENEKWNKEKLSPPFVNLTLRSITLNQEWCRIRERRVKKALSWMVSRIEIKF